MISSTLHGFSEMSPTDLEDMIKETGKDKMINILLNEIYFLQGKLDGINYIVQNKITIEES